MEAERKTLFKSIINIQIEEIRDVLSSDFFDEALNEINLNYAGKQNKRISALKDALSRLENESFGLCQECEEPISEGRLRINPETIYCINVMRN